jgi:hypothetical protein
MLTNPNEIVRHLGDLCRALEQEADRCVDAPLASLERAVKAVIEEAMPVLLADVVRRSQRRLWPTRRSAPWPCPACGGRGRGQSWRKRSVVTLCGRLAFERPWCVCVACGGGFSPTDQSLALGSRERLSEGVRAWLSHAGATTSFRAAAEVVHHLTGLTVGAETVRRVTEALGAGLESETQTAVQYVAERREAAMPVAPAPGELVVETDGVMVRYQDGWHEVKIGVVGGYQNGRLTAKSYTAARAAPEQFGPRLLAEAARRGALDVVAWEGSPLQRRLAVLRKVTVLGDGARWIWNLAAGHFGERTEIVDWYHATEHVWGAAKALYATDQLAAGWAGAQLTELWETGAVPVLAALTAVPAPTAEAAAVLQRERGYFRTNQSRMTYPAFREAGLPIGSGAVESSTRHVVQQRLKRAGCRGSEPGAQAVLNLCCRLAADEAAA